MTNNLHLESNGRCQLNENLNVDFNIVGAVFFSSPNTFDGERGNFTSWSMDNANNNKKQKRKNVIDYGVVMTHWVFLLLAIKPQESSQLATRESSVIFLPFIYRLMTPFAKHCSSSKYIFRKPIERYLVKNW